MRNGLIMTPGPTEVSERVRMAMAKPITNPDLDPGFFDFYDETCDKLKKILITRNDVLILNGEGILGLESAIASLIEPGDKVLCLANGVFGEGFGEFAELYGAEVVYLRKEYDDAFTVDDVKKFLAKNNGFKLATVVHCETPAGMINPIEEICPVLKEAGIITVVDAVSSIAGQKVMTDDWGIDIVLGGSQKCLSASPGLTFLSISKDAWKCMEERKTPVPGFYTNLLKWKQMWYKDRVFPYTQPVSDIYGLSEAADVVLEEGENIYIRHARIANAVRDTLKDAGFKIFPKEGAEANTVTAFYIPQGIDDEKFREHLWDKYNVMIAGSWGKLSGKVWRIGHMGENAREEKLFQFFRAFEKALLDFKYSLPIPIGKIFAEKI
ncbi:MAG TPA: alanine--glyoxylate aminotransferase family protein [Thermoanaerobacterales bacterium]|nr:alanine--glyoxylate aminotransferase family protein [Thermoanaerobacterales bacterium]